MYTERKHFIKKMNIETDHNNQLHQLSQKK